MLLDADLPKDDLASLQFIISASGPLDPETRDAFEQRHGIPVLLAYGATEFAGSVCTWTPDLYREFGASKRASSGKVLPDTEVRIVDEDTGAELETGEKGLLEARIASINRAGSAPPTWHRSTPTGSSRCTARPMAPSTAADSRSCRKPFAGCWFRIRRSVTPASSASATTGFAKCRWPLSRSHPVRRLRPNRSCSSWFASRCRGTTSRSPSPP